MGKKKTNTPEKMRTSEAEAVEEGASTTPKPSTETVSEDGASPEEIEAQEAEAEPSNDLEHMQKELTAFSDRHLRLIAEFTNYRRRAESELSEAWTRGQADMLRSFVDGLDDLQRVGAWQAESTTVEALVEGVDLVERKFRQALEAAGVEMIDPVGEPFDPNFMEAMQGVPTEDPEEDQKVQDVFQKGYSFKGHLVRPARVTVFKHE
jgi:molecular chaperone GrpE